MPKRAKEMSSRRETTNYGGNARLAIKVLGIAERYAFSPGDDSNIGDEKANAEEMPDDFYVREYITQAKYKTRQRGVMCLVREQRDDENARIYSRFMITWGACIRGMCKVRE